MSIDPAIPVFLAICAVGAVVCACIGRWFPPSLLQKVIRIVMYGIAILLLLVGVYVGVMAVLVGTP